MPVEVGAGVYASALLSDLAGQVPSDGVFSVETDDPAIHALLVRSDPTTGSPFLIASQ